MNWSNIKALFQYSELTHDIRIFYKNKIIITRKLETFDETSLSSFYLPAKLRAAYCIVISENEM